MQCGRGAISRLFTIGRVANEAASLTNACYSAEMLRCHPLALASPLLAISCAGAPSTPGSLHGSYEAISDPPAHGSSFAQLAPPWRDLSVEAVVQPWHRFVLGRAPSFASAAFVAEGAAQGGTDCSALAGGSGERDMFFVDGQMRLGLAVIEYITAENQARATTFLDGGQALPNGWTEYGSRVAPDVALFGRPGRPWVCATGLEIRSRVRATLTSDDRVPILARLPRDVAVATVYTPCASGGCLQNITVVQADDDVRERVSKYGPTRQPASLQVLMRDVYATPEQANQARAENLRYHESECTFRAQGNDLLQSCRRTPALVPH